MYVFTLYSACLDIDSVIDFGDDWYTGIEQLQTSK